MQVKIFYDVAEWQNFELQNTERNKLLYKFRKPSLIKDLTPESLSALIMYTNCNIWANLIRNIYLVPVDVSTYDLSHELHLAISNHVYTDNYKLKELFENKYLLYDYRGVTAIKIINDVCTESINKIFPKAIILLNINKWPHLITTNCNLKNNMLQYKKTNNGLRLNC